MDIRNVCVRIPSDKSELTRRFPQTTPDEHPVTPPPCRWPSLTTLLTPTKVYLVWRLQVQVPAETSPALISTLVPHVRNTPMSRIDRRIHNKKWFVNHDNTSFAPLHSLGKRKRKVDEGCARNHETALNKFSDAPRRSISNTRTNR